MAKIELPHPIHNKHLCYLTNMNFHLSDLKDYKMLLKIAINHRLLSLKPGRTNKGNAEFWDKIHKWEPEGGEGT